MASAFMSTDTFSSTESNKKNHKRRKLQKNHNKIDFHFYNSFSSFVLWLLLAEF